MRTKTETARLRSGCMLAAAGLLLAAGCGIFRGAQPKFQDVTVELGTESVSITDFMTAYASPRRVTLVSDPALVDLNRAGQTELVLRHGSKEETVVLSVVDTIAPTAEILPEYTVSIDKGIPDAAQLVRNASDMGALTVSYLTEPVIPADYRDTTVTVVVEDASGNRIAGDCVLHFSWYREIYTLEYGSKLTIGSVLLDPRRDAALVDQASLNYINGAAPGEYTLTGQLGDTPWTCAVTVQDTQGPVLQLKELRKSPGAIIKKELFLETVSDPSGIREVRMLTEINNRVQGVFPVEFEAEDNLGNITRGKTTLYINKDTAIPVFKGDFSDITVPKHSKPDLMKDISAWDVTDGACEVHCDTGKLDLDATGTYYITYSARDSSGNLAQKKRRIIVLHDEEDTAALVASIAASLSNDPEEIRDYIQSRIRYRAYKSFSENHDLVWEGLQNRAGNCMVFAHSLKAIFDYKGIENQLIWVTNKSHYWLIVKFGDSWKHMDPTPGPQHSKYSIMSDKQRRSTLNGRLWDPALWPACE